MYLQAFARVVDVAGIVGLAAESMRLPPAALVTLCSALCLQAWPWIGRAFTLSRFLVSALGCVRRTAQAGEQVPRPARSCSEQHSSAVSWLVQGRRGRVPSDVHRLHSLRVSYLWALPAGAKKLSALSALQDIVDWHEKVVWFEGRFQSVKWQVGAQRAAAATMCCTQPPLCPRATVQPIAHPQATLHPNLLAPHPAPPHLAPASLTTDCRTGAACRPCHALPSCC